jgi:aspartyl-tRNA(Asn)/glutamyl-tRNA(Gln) amidotransferase subunit A
VAAGNRDERDLPIPNAAQELGLSDLLSLTAEALLGEFRARRASPVEAVEAAAARIGEVDGIVGGFTSLCLERARREAAGSERAWARGEARPLEGLPFGAKDLFDSEGVRTAYGSPLFDAHVPARDAEAVRRARAAGAILVGKTQTHEFAWGITSVNEALGSARNPWAPERVSGGSSGGSAVALAAGEVSLALGSDTGGSIRVPAAFCGVVGLKPTYGRISAAGAWPLARSLDHPGPMARTPADAALLLLALAGADEADPATGGSPACEVELDGVRRGLHGLSVGVCEDLHLVPLAPDVRDAFDRAVRTVEAAGARIVEVRLPEAALVFPAFRVIQSAEALDTHRRAGLFPARRERYGGDVRGRLEAALEVTLEQYLAASADRQRVRAGFARLFASCDVLLTPVSAGSPLPIGEESVVHEGEEIAFRELVMPYTTPQDLAGLPACAVRAGFDALGIPVGVQFTAAPWGEAAVLRAAHGLWEATPELQARWPALRPEAATPTSPRGAAGESGAPYTL